PAPAPAPVLMPGEYPPDAGPYPGEQLVRDRPHGLGRPVYGQGEPGVLAEDEHVTADVGIRVAGDVDRHRIHRDVPRHPALLSVDQDEAHVAERPRDRVVIPGRDQADALPGACGLVEAAVPHPVARGHVVYLDYFTDQADGRGEAD